MSCVMVGRGTFGQWHDKCLVNQQKRGGHKQLNGGVDEVREEIGIWWADHMVLTGHCEDFGFFMARDEIPRRGFKQ